MNIYFVWIHDTKILKLISSEYLAIAYVVQWNVISRQNKNHRKMLIKQI